jgi:Cellulase (glycosyl hydrolase family 5)
MLRCLRKPAVAGALGLCLLTALTPVGLAAHPARAHSARVGLQGGVNIAGLQYGSTPAQADAEIASAQQLHVKLVRVNVLWSVMEPNGPSSIDPGALAFTDRLVSDAAAAGLRVIMTADGTPCWASSAPASVLGLCRPQQTSKANAWPPVRPADYASFVGFLAQRYGTRLAGIEIWNEPDQANQQYFAGPDKPRRYAAILRPAYTAIKHANPAVPVLAGSLVGSNGVFLRALYAAHIKGYYDGLSVHFYNLTLGSLRAIHEVQLANRDSKPLWLNEFGWSSCWPRYMIQQEQACVTPQAQATNIVDLYRSLARAPYVASAVVYDLQGSVTEDFGLLNGSGTPKPAFPAFSQALLSSRAQNPSPIKLSLRRRGSRIQASGSGPVGDYMQLEAFIAGKLRYRALFVLDRFNRYSVELPKALGTSGVQVRVFQYWAGAGKGIKRGI